MCCRWVEWRLEYWRVRYCNGIFRIRGIGCLMHTNVRVVWTLYSTSYTALYSRCVQLGVAWSRQHQHQLVCTVRVAVACTSTSQTQEHTAIIYFRLIQLWTQPTLWWRRYALSTETQDQCYKWIGKHHFLNTRYNSILRSPFFIAQFLVLMKISD